MGYSSVLLDWDGLRTITGATLNSLNWEAVGSQLTVQPRLFKLCNTTDQGVTLSFFGVDGTEIDYFPARSNHIYDITANKSNMGGIFLLAEGKQIYLKADGATTMGNVYITLMHGAEY